MLCTRSEVHLVRTFRVAHFCVNVVSIPFWTTKADMSCKSYNSLLGLALLNRNHEDQAAKISNAQFFSKHQIPNGQIPLRAPRLRYFSRLLCYAPAGLWHIIICESVSRNPQLVPLSYSIDVAWKTQKFSIFDLLRDPSDDQMQWCDSVKNSPNHFSVHRNSYSQCFVWPRSTNCSA
jgi:hypothetical protein